MPLQYVIVGLVVGVIFGFALQRGRFCMYSAIRDPLLLKDYKLIKAVLLVIFLEMIGFSIMLLAGIVTPNPKPFMPVAQIIGGLTFGVGMGFAGGCASGTTYRVGEGMMGSLVALLGLAIGALTTGAGLLLTFKNDTQAMFKVTGLTIGGDFNSWLMLIIGIVGFVLMLWKFLLPAFKEGWGEEGTSITDKLFKKGWPWWFTGIVIGIIAWIAWVASAANGRNYPLGITAGWLGWLQWFTTGSMADSNEWIAGMVLGVVVGAFIFSFIAGEFKLRVPKDGKTLLLQFFGGFMMGFGAVMAGGCNIGNFLSGVPMLSVGSILASVCIVAGAWLITYILFMREE